MSSAKFWIATTNKGKKAEILPTLTKAFPNLQLLSLSDMGFYAPPAENGKTFLENARIKAASLKPLHPEDWVLAEDSGLEVEGLGGLPGIHSARYAGEKAADSENNAKLLKMLQIRSANNRSARFVCHMIALGPNKEELITSGELPGQIGLKPVGQLGFGYDPLFIPNGQTQTMAELGPGFKLQFSHRAQALKALIEKLRNVL